MNRTIEFLNKVMDVCAEHPFLSAALLIVWAFLGAMIVQLGSY